jgi:drug/metabolite transporter (DMT)-like permease
MPPLTTRPDNLAPPAAVYVKLFLTAIFWGGTFIAGKLVAGKVGPYSAALVRFGIAVLFLLPMVYRVEGRLPLPRPGQVLPLILLGLTGVFAYNVCFFKGLELIEASRASLIIANNPVFIALFSALFFREPLSPKRLLGICLSVCGAMVVITRGEWHLIAGGGLGWGEVFILGSVASWVTFSLVGKALLADLPPLTAVCYAALSGALCLAPPAWREGLGHAWTQFSLLSWGALFYLGFFGTVLGFVWYYQGIQAIGAMKAGVFINFVPVSAIIFSFFILDEPLTASLVAGTILVLSGVYLTNRPTKVPHH